MQRANTHKSALLSRGTGNQLGSIIVGNTGVESLGMDRGALYPGQRLEAKPELQESLASKFKEHLQVYCK